MNEWVDEMNPQRLYLAGRQVGTKQYTSELSPESLAVTKTCSKTRTRDLWPSTEHPHLTCPDLPRWTHASISQVRPQR